MVELMLPHSLASPMQASLRTLERPTDCAAVQNVLDNLITDEADALTVARVESHAAHCPPCRHALTAARAYRRTMRRVGGCERAAPALRSRVVELLRQCQ